MKLSNAVYPPNCPWYTLFRPFYWYGCITGQCYTVSSDSKCAQKFLFGYCCVVLVFLLYFFVRMVLAFDFSEAGLNTKTLLEGLMAVYVLLTVGSQLCTIVVQLRLRNLCECVYEALSSNHLPDYTFLRRILYLFIGFCVFFSIGSGIVTYLLSIGIIKLPYRPTLVNHDHRFTWIDGIAAGIAQNSLTYCCCFYGLLCFTVRQNLIALAESMGNANFSPSIVIGKATANPQFGSAKIYQKRYHFLYKSAKYIESFFGFYCLFMFLLLLPMFCVTLFTLVKEKNIEVTVLITLLFWLGIMIFQMVFIIVPSIAISDQNDRLLDKVYEFYFASCSLGLSKTDVNFIQFLAYEIKSTDVGISANGFFNINRSFIMTLLSVIATYFIIIIQFDMSNTTPTVLPVQNFLPV